MQRRKLSLYTLMFAAGITAGFFIFERSRAAEAVLFALSVFVFILLADVSDESGSTGTADGSGRSLRSEPEKGVIGCGIRKDTEFRISLAASFAAGLILFAMRYSIYSAQTDYALNKQQFSIRTEYARNIDGHASQNSTLLFSEIKHIGITTLNRSKVKAVEESELIKAANNNAEEKKADGRHFLKGKVISSTEKNGRLRLMIKREGKGPDKVIVSLKNIPDDPLLSCGSAKGAAIEARGSFTELEPADNPGCFDYRLYMKSKGVTAGFRAEMIEVTDEGHGPIIAIRRHLYDIREEFINSFDEDYSGFIRGVIFGDKSEIDEDVLDEFNANSTGHILAVSGLHIGFLYTLMKALTRRKRTSGVSILIIAVILLYGEMTLWSAATVRACIVMTVSLISVHLRRSSDLLTSVSFAALLILIHNPYQLFSTGFQMSFLAMGGIAFLVKPVSMITGETLGTMLSVQAGTVPVTAYTFCRINPLAMFINIPIILLSSVLVPLCMMVLMTGLITGNIPNAGVKAAELIAFAVIGINRILGLGGEFSLNVAGSGGAATIAMYLLMFGLSSEWVRIMLLRKNYSGIAKHALLLMLPVLVLGSCLYDSFADDEVVFVAVGQGDCTHIRSSGHNILIDGGGVADFSSNNSNSNSSGNNSDYDNSSNRSSNNSDHNKNSSCKKGSLYSFTNQ
ncbi:MAG: DUF4131 domain-containing protein, partial [Clostridiales bacterium]|nr:DUF4131 domain-containing protein [Clostridiales bacterium]